MSLNLTRFGFMPKSSGLAASRRMGGFVLDATEVLGNMKRLNIVVMPAKIRRGLTLAGTKFMVDTVSGQPTTPIKRPGYSTISKREAGELRASGALFVNGRKVGNTKRYGESATGRYQPILYGGTPIPPMSKEACLVFNAPYAAKQHEEFLVKTEPTAGMYFMSTKLYGNGVEYMAIIARAIRL